jgi:formylglycine-generating enzyme required for sulfatase activity
MTDASFEVCPSSLERKTIHLSPTVSLSLVRLPAGEFLMGDPAGEADEQPPTRVAIRQPFWMSACEISNEQFRQFDASHDSRYYQKRYPPVDEKSPSWEGPDGRGLTLNASRQPVVRVSWDQAMAFCRWLSARTGARFTLPTEAQWEWAARAGTVGELSYGGRDAEFPLWANLADFSFSRGLGQDGRQATGGLDHLLLEGAFWSVTRFNDQSVVTAEVGLRRPNAWGLHDLHGNAAEWTRTTYAAYPYAEEDGRNEQQSGSRKVVRGGSFYDPPARARSAFRLAYPSWQRVFNVGFRVVSEDPRILTPAGP